jgi:hypothetical protein
MISPARARQRVSLSPAEFVEMGQLYPDNPMPQVIRARRPDLNPSEWAACNVALIQHHLDCAGAILFRGFRIPDAGAFRSFVAGVSPSFMDYRERAAPRRERLENIYTSTEFPPEYPIPMHHELAFAYRWPFKIWFYCSTPSETGGATPIAHDREFLKLLDPEIFAEFKRKGVMYVRNFGPVLDISWQEAFQTDRQDAVEAYCRAAGLICQWSDKQRLRTIRQAPAIRKHPKTGEPAWFNHAHLFHIVNIEPTLRDELVSELDPEEYPRNVFYGDGTPIDGATIEEIKRTYECAAVRFDWQPGDVLLLDNNAVAHGRDPFTGNRLILVAMTEPSSADEVSV